MFKKALVYPKLNNKSMEYRFASRRSLMKSKMCWVWRRPEKIKNPELYDVIYLQDEYYRTQVVYELRSNRSLKYKLLRFNKVEEIKKDSLLYKKLLDRRKHVRFEPLNIYTQKVIRKRLLEEKNLKKKTHKKVVDEHYKFIPKKEPGHLFRKRRFLKKYRHKLIKFRNFKKIDKKVLKKYRKFIPKKKPGHLFRKTRCKLILKKKTVRTFKKKYNKTPKLNLTKFRRVFKYNLIFIKKLFTMFIKKGLKQKVIKFYAFFVAIINRKIKYNKFLWNVYIAQIAKNIMPLFDIALLTKRGEKIVLPWLMRNRIRRRKKILSISCNWIKKAVLLRKEKTLFLKIISELESIRQLANSHSLTLKNEYYTNFYKNKYFIKFLKKREWI